MKTDILLQPLTAGHCTPGLLAHFNRYQEVRRCWRSENGAWVLRDIAFVEQWNDAQKAEAADWLLRCVGQGGAATGAYSGRHLIGFASVSGTLSGTGREYLNLEMLHVSHEFRGHGIGTMLFHAMCAEARSMGAQKLYISAHSSEESQAFYRALGCCDAAEINPRLFEAEPFDRHLEFRL